MCFFCVFFSLKQHMGVLQGNSRKCFGAWREVRHRKVTKVNAETGRNRHVFSGWLSWATCSPSASVELSEMAMDREGERHVFGCWDWELLRAVCVRLPVILDPFPSCGMMTLIQWHSWGKLKDVSTHQPPTTGSPIRPITPYILGALGLEIWDGALGPGQFPPPLPTSSRLDERDLDDELMSRTREVLWWSFWVWKYCEKTVICLCYLWTLWRCSQCSRRPSKGSDWTFDDWRGLSSSLSFNCQMPACLKRSLVSYCKRHRCIVCFFSKWTWQEHVACRRWRFRSHWKTNDNLEYRL